MMRVSQEFSGKYWKADQLTGSLVLTIRSVQHEALMGDAQNAKWVLYFNEDPRGLVLNVTNGKTIGKMLGDDSDGWVGKQIELYGTQTNFSGKMVDCIRVREPHPINAAPAKEEIPF